MPGTFYLHEDEWGLVELLPRENLAERQRVVAEATAHGEAHRAPDGIGWTAMYVAPAAALPIVSREITLQALSAVLGPGWERYDRVTSGYSSYREDCPGAYAFRSPAGDDFFDVVYGDCEGPFVASLAVTSCEPEIAAALHRLGTAFTLILCDLRRDVVVDLEDELAIRRYLAPQGR